MSNENQVNKENHSCFNCNKNVLKSQPVIECTNCKLWTHLKCNNLDSKDFKYRQSIKISTSY